MSLRKFRRWRAIITFFSRFPLIPKSEMIICLSKSFVIFLVIKVDYYLFHPYLQVRAVTQLSPAHCNVGRSKVHGKLLSLTPSVCLLDSEGSGEDGPTRQTHKWDTQAWVSNVVPLKMNFYVTEK